MEYIDKAKLIYEDRFGIESKILSLNKLMNVIIVEFGGNVIYSCCSVDYFEDFALLLEELSGFSHIVFSVENLSDRFKVKIGIIDFIEELKKIIEKCKDIVEKRIKEFENIGTDEDLIFKELCFCILTANFSAEKGIIIQNTINNGFINLSKEELYNELIKLGYRYPNRSEYIIEARKYYGNLLKIIKSFSNTKSLREWLVKNIKGIGYKEASHFLRNIGFKDVAIIDRHILRFLKNKGLIIEDLKNLTRKRYLEIENLLSGIANKLNITLAELDLYIWYLMTGKILK
jgi:N-glycosylase/DNA lyase